MRTKIIIAVIVIALIAIASIVIAQGAKRGQANPPMAFHQRGPGCGMGLQRWAKELNLTQTQIARMQEIHQTYLTNTETTRQQLMDACNTLRDMMTVDNPDPSAIKTQIAQMDSIRVGLRNAGVDALVAAWTELTPAQKAQVREKVKSKNVCGMMLGCDMLGAGMGSMGQCPMAGKGMGAGRGPSVEMGK